MKISGGCYCKLCPPWLNCGIEIDQVIYHIKLATIGREILPKSHDSYNQTLFVR
jgi:hypothetical protein